MIKLQTSAVLFISETLIPAAIPNIILLFYVVTLTLNLIKILV